MDTLAFLASVAVAFPPDSAREGLAKTIEGSLPEKIRGLFRHHSFPPASDTLKFRTN